MFYKNLDIVFQETPGEISLAFSIAGCPLRCPGCHSSELWTEKNGSLLSPHNFTQLIDKYRDLISCVLFLGGEWRERELCELLQIAKSKGLKTCLYSGLPSVSRQIAENLDYLKTGQWIERLGGLNSPTTNQKYINVTTGENLNHLFRR